MKIKSYFSTFELAKMCHVSPGSISRWIHEGKVSASVTAGGHYRIQNVEAVRLLQSLKMPPPEETKDSNGNPPRVLIVDDEGMIRSFLKRILEEKFPGVLLEEAEDGFEIGTKLHSFRPDLIVLDLCLPGLDGFHVCQFIRQHPDFKNIKILVVTGLEEKAAEEKILRMGADEFLRKPLDLNVFSEKVLSLLETVKRYPKE